MWSGAPVEVGLVPPQNLPDRSRGDQIWAANSSPFSRFCNLFTVWGFCENPDAKV